MAGMKDEAGRGGQGRCLAEDHLSELQLMVDEGMAGLRAVALKPGDVLAVERKTRAVGAMARTIKLVDGLRLGLQLGIAPDAFWRLSVREWRMLTDRTDRPGGPTMGRETFERLADDWPDEGART